MKKIVTLVALSIIITGCVSSGKVSVKREQLSTTALFWKA